MVETGLLLRESRLWQLARKMHTTWMVLKRSLLGHGTSCR